MLRLPLPFVAAVLVAPTLTTAAPPLAAKRPVTDTYWGVEVVDEYQYLEHVTDDDVARWAKAQNEHTRAWLDSRPQREAILRRVVELTHAPSPSYWGLNYTGGRLFSMKHQPPKEQPFLVGFDPGTLRGQRVLVDPNEIDSTGATTIDFYVPSSNAELIAVSMSTNGTEDGTVRVLNLLDNEWYADTVPRVNGGTAGGDVAWLERGGFFYTRYPHPGERPEADLPFYQQIYYHRLGRPDPDDDDKILGDGFPRIAEIEFEKSPDAGAIVAQVSNGDGGEYSYYLRTPRRRWDRIADFEDKVIAVRLASDAIYMLSRDGAPHKKILKMNYLAPSVKEAEVVVPETEAVIRSFLPTATKLYVVEMLGGPTQLRVYDRSDWSSELVPTGEPSTISGLVDFGRDEVLLSSQSYHAPRAYYRYDPARGRMQKTPLAHESPADFSDCEVRREFATADDGTRIPITIVMQKGTKLDGSAPLLLYGYGSYGMTLSPYFSAHRRVWIEQGGIYAVANIRGGGAYGDGWHRAANLENKKISIDDFAACARYLAEQQYTSPQRLAIQGGSAGGLLVLGTMIHHPDVAAAVLANVGIGDVLRVETSPNGEFNITEFGTVKDETQFRGMHAYSPYHHVTDGTKYPAVMATTGMNDPRVEPWQSFKMVARLQASGTTNPVLMRVTHSTGHGSGTGLSERDQQLADAYTFLFAALDVPYEPIE